MTFRAPLSHLIAILLLPAAALPQNSAPPASGVTVHDKAKAFAGFTLYPVERTPSVRLLNMSGEIVHEWRLNTVRAKLLPNCRLLIIVRNEVQEYSWEGELLWKAEAPNEVHHDATRLSSGNTLLLYRRPLMYRMPEAPRSDPQRKGRSDTILEVDAAGAPVWHWNFDEHIDFYSCGPRRCVHSPDSTRYLHATRDWSHANTVRVLPENPHFSAGDARFRPGNIITLARNLWSVFIIDRETGEIAWKYSGDYKGGLRFPHESHMIEGGLPGAGNILIFDNGSAKRGSFALEVDPLSKKVVWVYENGRRFFSKGMGSLMRLPNGNTFISEDTGGRAFEVTQSGEIVWEYKGPAIRRASRYAPDYCPNLPELKLM